MNKNRLYIKYINLKSTILGNEDGRHGGYKGFFIGKGKTKNYIMINKKRI